MTVGELFVSLQELHPPISFTMRFAVIAPLAPPLHSNRSWDALADSLWSGLDELEDEKIAIFWPNSDRMKKAESDAFAIATNILTDLCASLADQNRTTSRTKALVVFQTKN